MSPKKYLPKSKWILICFSLLLLCNCQRKPDYVNGIGTLTYFSDKSKSYEAQVKEIGEEVWRFTQAHPEAKSLQLILWDECKNKQGEKVQVETRIKCSRKELKTFATYKNATTFNDICYEWGVKIVEWNPCDSRF